VALLLVLVGNSIAMAQLFGSRSVGQPISGRSGSSRFNRPGVAQGNERFVRGSRGRGEFIGSAQPDQRGFVGNEQARASGGVVSSIAGLRERTDPSRTINRPLELPGDDELYHPRLALQFVAALAPTVVQSRLQTELSATPHFSQRCHFWVLVEERTAILRGEVTSAAERDLAELLALVEPGISRVQNDLQVAPVKSIQPPPSTVEIR